MPKLPGLPSTAWNRIGQALLLAILALNVYRAVTQSITTDEAFTYHRFVSQPFGGLLQPSDSNNANNHVLNSLLARVSIGLFGLSEFTLRLPSVVAGAVYLFAAYRLSFLLFGNTAWGFLTTALLVTNPFLLDHLSAARGYGIALAFLMLADYHLIRAMPDARLSHLYAAGVSCGLAVAANLTSIFPVAALMVAFAAASGAGFRLKRFWDGFLAPAVLVSFLFVIVPLSKTPRGAFYFGARNLRETVASLADLSFAYGPVRLSWMHDAVWPASLALLLACSAFLVWHLRTRRLPAPAFFAAALLTAVAIVAAAHWAAGVPYPLTRTGLYFIPLGMLAASCLLHCLRSSRVARYGSAALAILCLGAFLRQANASSYAEWRFDAGTKRIAQFIRARNPPRPIVLRASWPLEPSLNFYRKLYHLSWVPVDRSPLNQPGDLWVLISDDRDSVAGLRLQVVYQDPVSDTVVAQPRSDRAP